jgi:hypothetical protein
MYEERILAFIDILGFSDSIYKTINNDIEVKEETIRISKFLDAFTHQSKTKGTIKNMVKKSRIANHFSDTIVISYLRTDDHAIHDILHDIRLLYLFAIPFGFLIRGGIVCGKIYHKQNKIFGPALIKAYEIEKSVALYPRIVLDEMTVNIYEIYIKKYNEKEKVDSIKRFVCKDFDGQYYLNYFNNINLIIGDKEKYSENIPFPILFF